MSMDTDQTDPINSLLSLDLKTQGSFRRPSSLAPMPITYHFKDSRSTDSVAKALIFVSKFSKKQALVKFSDSSVSIIWGGSPKTYYIQTASTYLEMFKNKPASRHLGIDHSTVIQVNPSILGKTIKGGTSDRNVSIAIHRPNKIKVYVNHVDESKRTIVHTLPCEMKTLDDYRSMLIEEIEPSVCSYDTRSYVDNIHQFKHMMEIFVKLQSQRIHILSNETNEGNLLTVKVRTQGSSTNVYIKDLENGFSNSNEATNNGRRKEAGVYVDTKKLSTFLSSLVANRRSKVCFEIAHNKCLKITLDNELGQGEKFYQSILLLHSLIS